MRENIPSCILAPPDDAMLIRGAFFPRDASAALEIFSPTTEPMLPPMNEKSITVRMTGKPFIAASPETAASGRPLFF